MPDARRHLKLHNSDRQSFLGCRRRWNWVSDLREGYKPIETPKPLYFGSAIHAGAQTWYQPETWHLTRNPDTCFSIQSLAIAAFDTYIDDTINRYIELTGRQLDDLQRAEIEEAIDLGHGMLNYYIGYSLKHDNWFEPVACEIDFEYDLDPKLFGLDPEWFRVTNNGRIDLLARDLTTGKYKIVDHKTTARLSDNMGFLEMDEQMGSYALFWNLTHPEMEIDGCIYNEMYKDYPKPPTENATVRLGRRFSVNRQQATDYETYKRTLEEAGEPLELYADFLDFLKMSGRVFFRRTTIHRSAHELVNLYHNIMAVQQDMLDPNIRIYPHAGRWSCDNCAFRQPCLAVNDGTDYQWILENNFVKENRT